MKRIKKWFIYLIAIVKMVYKFVFHHDQWLIINRNRKRKVHLGNFNKDKTFYIIRWETENWGVFSTWAAVLSHMDYAIAKGYIPIVDLKNYYVTMMQDIQYKNKENAWDYYFDQKYSFDLEEVYKSKNVILSGIGELKSGFFEYKMPMPMTELLKWNSLAKEYCKFNKDIINYVNRIKAQIFPTEQKILGVSVRMGYTYLKELKRKIVNNHPVQGSLEEYIRDIGKYIKEWKCKYFFLSIDDREAGELFRNKFGENCILMKRTRLEFFKNGCVNNEIKNNSTYQRTREYIAEIILLSECNCLLASKSGGVEAAYILNGGKYEHIKIYSKGEIATQ